MNTIKILENKEMQRQFKERKAFVKEIDSKEIDDFKQLLGINLDKEKELQSKGLKYIK